eukprot:325766_1
MSYSPVLCIPLSMILLYPFAIYTLCGFSIYPVLTHMVTIPDQVGKRPLFYRKMYKYCCAPGNRVEFYKRLLAINYVCVQSYFDRLSHPSYDKYDSFARALHSKTPMQLYESKYLLDKFYPTMKHQKVPEHLVSAGVNFKLGQLLVRTISIICCLCLDIFYFETFQRSSEFMIHYETVLIVLGLFGASLFCIWLFFIFRESKWNLFCRYMIAARHELFVLVTTIDDFTKQCDDILLEMEPKYIKLEKK